jgi:copper homeostasis protein
MLLAARLPLPVRALCRPQAGGFAYDAAELALVEADALAAIECGLEGVVIGAGNRAGLDAPGLSRIIARTRAAAQARGRSAGLTLHRVFDTLADMAQALEIAIELGFDTILTSGGANRAHDGADVLGALVRQAAGRITVLAGSGIDAAAVPTLHAAGIRAFHASCRQPIEDTVDPDLARLGFVEARPLRTNAASVRHLREAIALQPG